MKLILRSMKIFLRKQEEFSAYEKKEKEADTQSLTYFKHLTP